MAAGLLLCGRRVKENGRAAAVMARSCETNRNRIALRAGMPLGRT